MNITLYRTNNNPNDLNKNLILIEELSGKIVEPCAILNPVFKLNTRNFNFNYIFSNDFNRYYFVEKIDVLNGGHINVYCKVDVLMSHKTDILKSQVIAERSTSNYNKYVPDSYDITTAEKRYSFSRFPFSFDTSETSGNHYILTIGGK